MRPIAVIDACKTSHQRLLRAVAPLTDDDLRAPSGLPRWSRAHVLAHVINKANAHVWIFGGPAAGEVRHLHPPGHDANRAADGARRSARGFHTDLRRAFERLDHAWDALDDGLWDRQGVMMAGPRTMVEIVGHHLRNVEVHHVDLRIGYRPADWPGEFVEGELHKRLRDLPSRAVHADLLAWLLDRAAAPDLGPW